MRIAHLVHMYPPEFRGGTEACVESLAAEQLARGDEPLVIAGSDERSEAGEVTREEVGGVPVWRVRRTVHENYSMDPRHPRVAGEVLRLLEQAAPAIVHVHHTLNLSGDVISRVRAAGHTVVATLHDFTLVCARFFLARPDGESCAEHFPLPSERCLECVLPDFPGGREQLEHELRDRIALSRSETAALALAMVPSRFVAERWQRSGLFDDERLVLLPHAPRLPCAQPPEHVPAPDRLRLVTWGHLAPAKGVHHLLEAMSRLEDPRVSLAILGEPTEAAYGERLRALADGLPVVFHGAYRSDALVSQAAACDLAVFPSLAEETFGLVVAEARALGLPVLVTDRGALAEGVGPAGDVVPAGDVQQLAGRLNSLLADPGTLAGWRAAAVDASLSPSGHATRVDDLYQRALQSRPA